mmetsp:Transcript_50854/g.76033  ORF Transcript_50854/g.76033 Transcript_50854/m.76033 type:complete len:330 (-) Transcript_50854:344-1333(-)
MTSSDILFCSSKHFNKLGSNIALSIGQRIRVRRHSKEQSTLRIHHGLVHVLLTLVAIHSKVLESRREWRIPSMLRGHGRTIPVRRRMRAAIAGLDLLAGVIQGTQSPVRGTLPVMLLLTMRRRRLMRPLLLMIHVVGRVRSHSVRPLLMRRGRRSSVSSVSTVSSMSSVSSTVVASLLTTRTVMLMIASLLVGGECGNTTVVASPALVTQLDATLTTRSHVAVVLRRWRCVRRWRLRRSVRSTVRITCIVVTLLLLLAVRSAWISITMSSSIPAALTRVWSHWHRLMVIRGCNNLLLVVHMHAAISHVAVRNVRGRRHSIHHSELTTII